MLLLISLFIKMTKVFQRREETGRSKKCSLPETISLGFQCPLSFCFLASLPSPALQNSKWDSGLQKVSQRHSLAICSPENWIHQETPLQPLTYTTTHVKLKPFFTYKGFILIHHISYFRTLTVFHRKICPVPSQFKAESCLKLNARFRKRRQCVKFTPVLEPFQRTVLHLLLCKTVGDPQHQTSLIALCSPAHQQLADCITEQRSRTGTRS